MKRIVPISAVLALLALFFLWGCSDDSSSTTDGGGGGQLTGKTCLGCHSSEELLQASMPAESGSKVEVAIKSDG
jgi:mono/diheme cytochrome c family protein